MSYSIGQLAKVSGVSIGTVRYFQRLGLLSESSTLKEPRRSYDSLDVKRLLFVRQMQALGFTLSDVADLLSLESGVAASDAKRVSDAMLKSVRERIAKLLLLERALVGMPPYRLSEALNRA